MSNQAPSETEPSDRKVLFSAFGWIGVIFIFALILAVAYLPNRAVDAEEINAGERLQLRQEVEAEQDRLVASYEWVNLEEGTVRLPVERAMRLTVEDLRADEKGENEPAP
jgi:hypothetical protein